MEAKNRLAMKLDALEAVTLYDGDVVRLVDSCRRALVKIDDEHRVELANLKSLVSTLMQTAPMDSWMALAGRLDGAAKRIETAVQSAEKYRIDCRETAPALEN